MKTDKSYRVLSTHTQPGGGGGGGGGGGSGGGKAAVPKILTKLNEHCHVKYDTLDKQHELQVLSRQSCTCMQSG